VNHWFKTSKVNKINIKLKGESGNINIHNGCPFYPTCFELCEMKVGVQNMGGALTAFSQHCTHNIDVTFKLYGCKMYGMNA
jgi:hypothetical protein